MSDPVLDILSACGVDFEMIPIDPALADTSEFCEAYGFAMVDSANTILVVGKADPPLHVACVVLAHTRLDVNRTVRKRLGVRKASFAPGEEHRGVDGHDDRWGRPLGLPEDLPLWVDSRVMDRPRIILGGGGRNRKVLVSPDALTAIGADVVEGLAIEASA